MNNLAIYYFHQGTTIKAYELLGAHYTKKSTRFCVWAPNAVSVSVVGEFNNWDPSAHQMIRINNEGLYEITINGVKEFACYQYAIKTKRGKLIYKSDPYAFHSELRPAKASKVYNLKGYKFKDSKWMKNRIKIQGYNKPLNVYELHLGSWRRYSDGNTFNYADIALELAEYVKEMGYTHIEVMPLSEYPYDPSWGYQVTGYFSVTSRYGTPKDFMKFVDIMHQNGIGVIMDWVPGHFTKDAHGLIEFDGKCLYEPSNKYRKENPSWGTRNFDYGRTEIQSFLVSSAIFWCDVFHIDGLRTDAVSSMLYLDYCREEGQWQKNSLGTNINLEAVAFIKKLNKSIKDFDPSILSIAEESTAYPRITAPYDYDGLGYDYKWNMGWMNDTLRYIKIDPLFRGDNSNLITFQMTYIFSEQYILALSHDEVVHLKKSMIDKIPGLYDQKFAGLKTYMTYMMTHPGKKLNFMGSEIGQFREWSEMRELDWSVLQYERHQTLQKYIKDLNKLYITSPSLYDDTTYWDGFEWVVVNDNEHSVFAYKRKSHDETLLVILNFAYCEWNNYTLNIDSGDYEVVLCSEDEEYSGSKKLKNTTYHSDGKLIIDLPYNSGIILRKER
jgi:1,4-alpha-glucan branching enzyme